MLQQTIKKQLTLNGTAVHSGQLSTMVIHPAPINHGIVFKRVDIKSNNIIPASYDAVIDTSMCTVLANSNGVKISTVEHLMAAIWGCNIHNALIEIDGPEIPIMDGSSRIFVNHLKQIGVKKQPHKVKTISLKHPISITHGDKSIYMEPSDHFSIDCHIEFEHCVIGKQKFSFDSKKDSFNELIAGARTFGFSKDLDRMKRLGLAKGASLENAIGLDEKGVMNQEGLRYPDEFARHKVLDCIGDFALAGGLLKAKVTAIKPGHYINNAILHKVFESQLSSDKKSPLKTNPALQVKQAF